MGMDISWPRWSYSSILKHFSTEITTIPVFIEGMDRETDTIIDFAEIRIDGPWMNELSADYWRIYTEINICTNCPQIVIKAERVVCHHSEVSKKLS